MKLTDTAIACLRAAGWSPERQINITLHVAMLENEGYEVSEMAASFLRSFGDLQLQVPNAYGPGTDEVSFKVITTVKNRFKEHVDYYAQRIGAPSLCLIGEMYQGYLLTALSPDGRMVAGFDEELFLVGVSPEDALNKLCAGVKLTRIP